MSDAVFESYLGRQNEPKAIVLTNEEREALKMARNKYRQIAEDQDSLPHAVVAATIENLLARAGATEGKA